MGDALVHGRRRKIRAEEVTRRKRIDPKLTGQGWKITDFDPKSSLSSLAVRAIAKYPTDNGPADYALCNDSNILDVMEAKKVTLGPQNVLTQAERYSRGLTQNSLSYPEGFHVPFLYSTIGEIIWLHDIRHPPGRAKSIIFTHLHIHTLTSGWEKQCGYH